MAWWKTRSDYIVKATEKYYETIFEELRELEVKKSKETLLLVQKKHILIRYQSEREGQSENVAKVARIESDKKGGGHSRYLLLNRACLEWRVTQKK